MSQNETLTDKQRLEKLEQAKNLIREVEFSYPQGNEDRQAIYSFIVHNFSLGAMAYLMDNLRKKVKGY